MRDFLDMLPFIMISTTVLAIAVFVVISFILFIRDGIQAKREGRERNGNYTALFIISIIIVIFAILFFIFLSIMASRIMLGM